MYMDSYQIHPSPFASNYNIPDLQLSGHNVDNFSRKNSKQQIYCLIGLVFTKFFLILSLNLPAYI